MQKCCVLSEMTACPVHPVDMRSHLYCKEGLRPSRVPASALLDARVLLYRRSSFTPSSTSSSVRSRSWFGLDSLTGHPDLSHRYIRHPRVQMCDLRCWELSVNNTDFGRGYPIVV